MNIANYEYGASDTISLSIIAGTKEYDLPDDFSDLASISNEANDELSRIAWRDIPGQENVTSYSAQFSTFPNYYIRDHKI